MEEFKSDNIIFVPIQDEVEHSYLVYSLSVIIGRAIPDVRDGLKPVHRRILYSMWEQGITHEKGTKKCARIVGDVLGKYHPHGDVAIYETLVRMAQTFSLRYPLVYGQGNFGSIDGDNPAAMRYTEAKLMLIAQEMLKDLENNTVQFKKNFDESMEEPEILPAQYPQLIVNGSEGIAVGMATAIPPHNLGEVINALIYMIDHMECTTDDLLEFVKGPDFPTKGFIFSNDDVKQMYRTGKGRVCIRAKIVVEEQKDGTYLIVSEIPYQENKALIIKRIADLVKDGTLEEIINLRDESDQSGIRIVIKIKRQKDENIVLAKLYKYTNLQKYYNANMIAIHNYEPKIYNLKDMLFDYYQFKREILVNRYTHLLKKAHEKMHILEGLIIAIKNIDEVIAIIKKSKDSSEARASLIKRFALSKAQAEAILDMRLSKLTSLEITKLENDYEQIKKDITHMELILSTEENINKEIKSELIYIRNKFTDERQTAIIEGANDIENADITIIKQEVIIMVTKDGYVKKMSPDKFKLLQKGSKGQLGFNIDDGDYVRFMQRAFTTDMLLVITSKGKSYHLIANDVPDGEFRNYGSHIGKFLNFDDDEYVNSINIVNEFSENLFLIMITKQGVFKKMELSLLKNKRISGVICIKLNEKDVVVDSLIVNDEDNVFIATAFGYMVRFKIGKLNDTGRTSIGVRGVRLLKGDFVVNMTKHDPSKNLLIVTSNGYGKKVPPTQITITNRGVKGVRCISNIQKAGLIQYINTVSESNEIIMMTKKGHTFKISVQSMNIQNRNTLGVRLIRLNQDDSLSDIAVLE